MRQSRFYINQVIKVGEPITLPATVFHHLITVLRKSAGQEIIIFNGDGTDYRAVIEQVDKKQAVIRVIDGLAVAAESQLKVTLAQGLSKGQRMDITLQKSVELGVDQIVLIENERSNVRIKQDNIEKKMSHWQNIIISACEQSGRAEIPKIHEPITLADWLENDNAEVKLLLSPLAGSTVDDIKPPKAKVSLLIGSEGGFTDAEIDSAERSGYQAIRLGPRVLRTETAALAAMAVIQSKWGDLS